MPPAKYHRFWSDLSGDSIGELPLGNIPPIEVIARMLTALDLGAEDDVLQVGIGTGYTTCLFAALAGRVYSIERDGERAELVRTILDAMGVGNVDITVGDGTSGRPDRAPYDAMLNTVRTETPPRPLLDQLAERGRLILPAPSDDQKAVTLERIVRRQGEYRREQLATVPMHTSFVDVLVAGGVLTRSEAQAVSP